MKGKYEIWVRRPVLWFLAAYIAGLIIYNYMPAKPVYLMLLMSAVLSAGFFLRKRALFPILLILIMLLGSLRVSLFLQRVNPLGPYNGLEVSLQGEIKGAPQVEKDRVIYVLQTAAVKIGESVYPIKTNVKVSVYPNTYGPNSGVRAVYGTGDFIQVNGTIKEPDGPRNPKGFDYKSYLARRSIFSIMSVKEQNVIFIRSGSKLSPERILASVRDRASSVLEQAVGGSEGNFLKAVILGQRWLIEPETEDDFTRTGLAHILAVSGLHVGYLVMLLSLIQSMLKLRKGAAMLLQAAVLLFYCFLTGASPSATRAVVMALIYLAGKALGRKSDIINNAGTAAFLILLFRPMDIFELSFQLSFLAVCSIGLFAEPIQNVLRFMPKKVASLIAAGLSAQLGTLPLTIYYFNLISPVSILANLVVLPVLGIVTAGGFLLIPLGMALPVTAVYAAIPIRLLSSLILLVTEFAADLPNAYIRVASPSVFTLVIAFLLIWMISRERPGFIRRPSIACIALIVLFLAVQLVADLTAPRELKLVFLDVGQGDCCFIQTPDRKNILIDGGGQAGVDTGEKVLLPFLLKNGISALDLVIMSHGHDDHISGLQPVLKQLRTKAFMEYPPLEKTPAYQELIHTVREKGIRVISAARGQTYRVGNETWLHVLYPDDSSAHALYQGNENNLSLVLLLECGDASVLFTGDIEKGVEYYLTGRMKRTASVLKVPHHGSSTSSTEAFLDAVSPQAAIIQSGINLFGHPHPQTLDRLKERNIEVYRNDLQGAVTLKFRDGKWYIQTMMNNTNLDNDN
ncbi:MAG TPA: DNA internalization-related competence protein ComEC/Rec2 [Clostridiales bacterium]|nr:DNA internalization-related competence protein ComEC/Rec2 [Clostridiales bacterium]